MADNTVSQQTKEEGRRRRLPPIRDVKWYGCRASMNDKRDVWMKPRAVRMPRKVDLSGIMPPVMNQLELGCCTGHGVTAVLRSHMRQRTGGHPRPRVLQDRLLPWTRCPSQRPTADRNASIMFLSAVAPCSQLWGSSRGIATLIFP